jgi:transglutaminase/protease-like cytokinesis protein 3
MKPFVLLVIAVLLYSCENNASLFDVLNTESKSPTGRIKDGVNWGLTSDIFYIPSGGVSRLQGIADEITKDETSQYDKARAIWLYVIAAVDYDYAEYDRIKGNGLIAIVNPIYTLAAGSGVCADYAVLYYCLADRAGLKVSCVYISGIHEWNEVQSTEDHNSDGTNDKLLIDATWGDGEYSSGGKYINEKWFVIAGDDGIDPEWFGSKHYGGSTGISYRNF